MAEIVPWTLILWLSGAAQPVTLQMQDQQACEKVAKPAIHSEWRSDGMTSHATCIGPDGTREDWGDPNRGGTEEQQTEFFSRMADARAQWNSATVHPVTLEEQADRPWWKFWK